MAIIAKHLSLVAESHRIRYTYSYDPSFIIGKLEKYIE